MATKRCVDISKSALIAKNLSLKPEDFRRFKVAIANVIDKELGGKRRSEVLNLEHLRGKKSSQIASEKAGLGNNDNFYKAKIVLNGRTPELALMTLTGIFVISYIV